MKQQELKLFQDRNILSVSELVRKLKFQLEKGFQALWITGEISNLTRPPSGHIYFTLKDSRSQLSAVCFRLRSSYLQFEPQDGMKVLARGSLSVYGPRGRLQIIIEHMEPAGQGALQMAFERLKGRLKAEGLFDERHKQPLPMLPSQIGVVTSPTGAAIQDILRVLQRRDDRVKVLIFPAAVQGSAASVQIVRGIRYLNSRQDVDVIVLARGGGSLEDLWSFNEESVARAIFHSRVPVISAVGHEVDFTIADFVADLRASTPSAAADLVCAARERLVTQVHNLLHRAHQSMRLLVHQKRRTLQRLSASRAFVDAESRLRFFCQRLDELDERLIRAMPSHMQPARQKLLQSGDELDRQILFFLKGKKQLLKSRWETLNAFSPLRVLERGYSIVTNTEGAVVRDASQVKADELVGIRVARGGFRARREGDRGV